MGIRRRWRKGDGIGVKTENKSRDCDDLERQFNFMKKKEELFTCPHCGTRNFTRRGLKAHVCKGKKR